MNAPIIYFLRMCLIIFTQIICKTIFATKYIILFSFKLSEGITIELKTYQLIKKNELSNHCSQMDYTKLKANRY